MVCWFAGLTTLDVVHRVARHPGPNEKVTAGSQHIAAGGPAANAAVVARALSAEVSLITALGNGSVSDLARADLEAHGVNPIDLARVHELSVSSIVVGPGGERSVVSADAGAPALDLDRRTLADLPMPRAVLLDGHHPDLQRAVLAEARARGAKVTLDAGRWRPIFADLIPRAHVIACSADFHPPGLENATDRELAGELLARGARAAAITHGADPVFWCDGEREGTVDVPNVTARDTLGAGDAFHGALTAALASGADLTEAVAEGVRVASIRVQHEGPRAFLARIG